MSEYKQTGPDSWALTNCDCDGFHPGYPEHVPSHVVFAREHTSTYQAEQVRAAERAHALGSELLAHECDDPSRCPMRHVIGQVDAALDQRTNTIANVRDLHAQLDRAEVHLHA